jgi:hypothetical protein
MFIVVEPDRSRLADLAQRLGEDGSSRSSGRCARSPKRLLRFPQTGELSENGRPDHRRRTGGFVHTAAAEIIEKVQHPTCQQPSPPVGSHSDRML